MREDLIERLEACANFHDLTWSEESLEEAVALLREAAAALEAAREDATDAARYRWLRGIGAGHAAFFLSNSDDMIDAAIDQARGKGVLREAE